MSVCKGHHVDNNKLDTEHVHTIDHPTRDKTEDTQTVRRPDLLNVV